LIAYFSASLTGCLFLAGVALIRKYRRVDPRALHALVGVILGISLWWSVISTMKFATPSLSLKVFFYRLEMVAWVGLPILTTSFALIGIRYSDARSRRLIRALSGFLAVLFVVSIFVPQSVLFSMPRLVTAGASVSLEHNVSVALGIITGVAWTITLVGVGIVVHRVLRGRSVPPVVVAAVAIPLFPGVVAILKLFSVYPVGGEGFNIAPVINSLAVTVFAAIAYQSGVQTVVPDSRHAAIETVEEGYLLVDTMGKVIDENDAARRLTDVSVGEQVPTWLGELPDERAGEQSVRTPAGREVTVQRNAVDSFETAPEVLLVRDRTEHLRRMRKLESRDFLIAGLPVGVFRVNEEASPRVVYANQRLAEMFGFPDADAVSGRRVAHVFGSSDVIADELIRSTAANPRPVGHEFCPSNSDSFWGLVSVYPSSTDETDLIEGVVVDISAEKRTEALLAEMLTDTARDRDLIEQLWRLLMSFNGFDDFADAALSVVATTGMTEAAYVVRPESVHDAEVDPVAMGGTVQLPRTTVSEAIERAYAEEVQHTTEFKHEGTSYDLIATPVVTEGVVDSVFIAVGTSPANDRLPTLADDVATALAYKRTLSHREQTADDGRFVALQVTVPNGLHPLSRVMNAADVKAAQLSFSVTRVDDAMTWLLTGGERNVCDRVTAAADADESTATAPATEVTDDRCRCQVGVDTADIHHRLSVEDVTVVGVSADVRTVEYSLRLPPGVDVAEVMAIFRTQWPDTRLQSRQAIEPEPITPRVFDELDERQREAVEVATRMGFFARPQGATAADVAEAMGVSRSTAMRRVRGGEKAVFESLFSSTVGHRGDQPDDRHVE
jgi:predicted DNA binding protein/PAS domain-containing protein